MSETPILVEIFCSYTRNWHAGRLSLTPPMPGTVVSWANTFSRYISIIEAIGESEIEYLQSCLEHSNISSISYLRF